MVNSVARQPRHSTTARYTSGKWSIHTSSMTGKNKDIKNIVVCLLFKNAFATATVFYVMMNYFTCNNYTCRALSLSPTLSVCVLSLIHI